MLISATELSAGHRRDFRLRFRRLLRLDEPQEPEQSLPLEPVELLREREKPPHVRVALFAARLREQPRRVMSFAQHRFQAARERHLPRQPPPCREILQKPVRLAPSRNGCVCVS